MLKFIRELIIERWIKVRVGGTTSQSKETDLGIPQERILSVTQYLVYWENWAMEWLDHFSQIIWQ